MVRRYIVIPEDVSVYEVDGKTQVKDKETDRLATLSFQKFLEGRTIDPAFVLESPPREGQPVPWTMPMIVSAEAVRASFRGKPPGDVVELDEDDYQRLKRATEKGTYHPVVAASCIGFMRAIVDAKIEDPRSISASAP